MTAPNTFWKLISDYDVQIPIIQRDYAQGREDDEANEIRASLLENIRDALVGNKRLDFDFVYGSIKDEVMAPLDGQQRLTTLFLLHWYFAVKENKDVSDTLVQFSYKTRISVQDFCRQFTLHPISYDELDGTKISKIITKKKWFQFRWQADPTVQAMLVMLDDMHEAYHSIEEPIIDQLIGDDCPITFSFLELEKFKLGDELYIKMNSRGKPLSTFENFKAQFEQLLEKQGFEEDSEDFSLKVEQEWTDLLWEYRDEDYTIDRAFMRFFTFISSALFLKKFPHEKNSSIFTNDFSKLKVLISLYKEQENVTFLFNVLSLWKDKQDIHQQFSAIFEELPLFGSNFQLFDKCIDNTLQLDERVLLYTIVVKKLSKQEDDLVDTLRVVRNLLNRIRQANKGEFNSNLRVENIGSILKTVDDLVQRNKPIYEALLDIENMAGFADRSLAQEKEKAELIQKQPQLKQALHELEDMPIIKGAIHQWLDAFTIYKGKLKETLDDIDQLSPALVARAMLSIENYRVKIGYSNLGPRYLFGGNRRNREFLWTNNDDTLKPILTKFIRAVINSTGATVKEKVELLISTDKWTVLDWQYYFIKYDTVVKDHYQVFTFSGRGPFDIERLSGVNLQAAHINPIYEAVVNAIGDRDICRIEDCQKRLSDQSEIKTTNGSILKLYGQKWTCVVDPSVEDDINDYAETIKNYDLVEQGYALVMKIMELQNANVV